VKGKLVPRYVGSYEIIEEYGPVVYRLRLPSQLAAIHDIFHVSQLKKCVRVPTKIVEQQEIMVESDLSDVEQPIKILDQKERSTRRAVIKIIKFSGTITPKKKPHGKLKVISIKIFLVFLVPFKVHTFCTLFLSESRDEILFKGGWL
jgi:hypothetical protein